jgi:hypothetical protein
MVIGKYVYTHAMGNCIQHYQRERHRIKMIEEFAKSKRETNAQIGRLMVRLTDIEREYSDALMHASRAIEAGAIEVPESIKSVLVQLKQQKAKRVAEIAEEQKSIIFFESQEIRMERLISATKSMGYMANALGHVKSAGADAKYVDRVVDNVEDALDVAHETESQLEVPAAIARQLHASAAAAAADTSTEGRSELEAEVMKDLANVTSVAMASRKSVRDTTGPLPLLPSTPSAPYRDISHGDVTKMGLPMPPSRSPYGSGGSSSSVVSPPHRYYSLPMHLDS